MFAHPGKKLHFMGMEFGQWNEWNYKNSLDWHLLDWDTHKGFQFFIKDLNSVYKRFPALYENDFSPEGFKWIDANDSVNSILSFVRYDKAGNQKILIVINFTPVPRYNYRIGVPEDIRWKEILNSDATQYGGSGMGNLGRCGIKSSSLSWRKPVDKYYTSSFRYCYVCKGIIFVYDKIQSGLNLQIAIQQRFHTERCRENSTVSSSVGNPNHLRFSCFSGCKREYAWI